MKTCAKCKIEKDASCFSKHDTTKDKLGSWCKDCVKAANRERYAIDSSKEKAYRDSHKEETKAYNDKYRAENAETLKAAKSEYGRLNKDKKRAYNLEHAAEIKETRRLYNEAHKEENRLYRLENKDRSRETKKIWKEANPDASRTQKNNRRAREKGNGGRLSKGLRLKLFTLQRGCCAICKKKLDKLTKLQHLDHIIAVSLGGANEDWNMQLLCARCNLTKAAKDNIKHMQSLGYLL